jgi:serine/threonine-protein kinase
MLVVGLVLAGMAVAAGAGMYAIMLFTMRGNEVVVPDLTRMTQAEAEAEAAKHQLKVLVAGTRVEPRVAEGRVFEQDPPAGSKTRPNRAVRVLLSQAAESLEVPALVGTPLRKAQLTLEQMGLRVGDVASVPSYDLSPDGVLAQRPAAGARRQKGEKVDLLVSRGAQERVYVMPALRGLEVGKATAILKDAGVRVGLSRRASETAQPGLVMDQQPPEGYPLRERQTVQLVVSQ